MNEKIIVNYNTEHDCNGCVARQRVTLSNNLMNRFNYFVNDCTKYIKKKHCISSEEMRLLSYGVPIEKDQKRCLYLTQVGLLKQFLKQNHIECTRLKTDRNTLVKLVD